MVGGGFYFRGLLRRYLLCSLKYNDRAPEHLNSPPRGGRRCKGEVVVSPGSQAGVQTFAFSTCHAEFGTVIWSHSIVFTSR